MANMGNMDPRFSVGGGLLATIAGLRRGGLPGMLMAGLGAALLYRGGKEMMGGSGEAAKSPAWMRSSVTIERDPMELYNYWRDFSNLGRFMRYIEEVRPVMGGERSHWVADVPMAGRIEWDSEITSDVPGERIGWRSVEGSEIETKGEVRFRKSMRGTEVEVEMYYKPPGAAGAVAAKLAKGLTESMLREDLKRFKSIMETGEAPTASMTQ